MKIAFAGDWHGDFPYAYKAIRHAAKNNVSVIIHTGDFGIWPSSTGRVPMLSLQELCEKSGITLMFIDGNHEHHHWLLNQPIDDDGFRKLTKNIWHVPRGQRWTLEGVKFLGFGGASSVDKDFRTEGIDWFGEERITYSQISKAMDSGECDIMITHDCPDKVTIPHNGMPLPRRILDSVEQDRRDLGMLVDVVKPKRLIHGHFHVRYDSIRTTEAASTLIHGLDMNRTPFDDNLKIFTLATPLELTSN